MNLRKKLVRTLGTSALVGIAATSADLVSLLILVEGIGLSAQIANWPSLLAGAAIQFLGCRYIIFQASAGDWQKQLGGFGASEIVTLALNGILFSLLTALTPWPYLVVRLLGTFMVFFAFSLPAWSLVFRAPALSPPKP